MNTLHMQTVQKHDSKVHYTMHKADTHKHYSISILCGILGTTYWKTHASVIKAPIHSLIHAQLSLTLNTITVSRHSPKHTKGY